MPLWKKVDVDDDDDSAWSGESVYCVCHIISHPGILQVQYYY